MGDKTKIEWTDATWNPVTGCTKVSAGCTHCYAERMMKRFKEDFHTVTVHPHQFDMPLKWKRPRRIFVVSMGDLFHPQVSASTIVAVFEVMAACPLHTFQVLTKRPERICPVLFGAEGRFYLGGGDYLKNVWLGVSCEDQATADARIPLLFKTPAAVRFISYEPALSRLDLDAYLWYAKPTTLRTPRLDWVIAGGETGPKARPTNPDWFRTVRDQCQAAGVPFLFKQWGEWCPGPGDGIARAGKKLCGRLLDGREWHEFPEVR